jgi:putative component of membrane protein insertase Oxa1/YidC/SpoIIIJ protein YidD
VNLAQAAALAGIRAYQRHISPRKGYRCAYACHTGGASCSSLGFRAVRRHGVVGGVRLLWRRLQRCSAAHDAAGPRRAHASQAGFCDLDCGDCDAGAWTCDDALGCADAAGEAPCGCGRNARPRKSRADDVAARAQRDGPAARARWRGPESVPEPPARRVARTAAPRASAAPARERGRG